MRSRSTNVVVIMGVAGVGKSTVASALALRLGWTFLEADDDHSAANIAKMRSGQPLDDDDRAGWIDAVRKRVMRHVAAGEKVVLACSALRRTHRRVLRSAAPHVVFVHLVAPTAVVERRLSTRTGHFAGTAILPAQIEDLEVPADALTLDARRSVAELVDDITTALSL
jgi:gluconokinase